MRKRLLTSLFILVAALTLSAQWADNSSGTVPAYNAAPPPRGQKLPPILPPEQLLGPEYQPYVPQAYRLAAKIPNTLYQQPCYCYCERMGHNSLHSCYESDHAAHCGACLQELYLSYSLHKKGRTAKQIREAIIRGDWKKVDLQNSDVVR
jgi:Protein of unknown function with PCYCGC motif